MSVASWAAVTALSCQASSRTKVAPNQRWTRQCRDSGAAGRIIASRFCSRAWARMNAATPAPEPGVSVRGSGTPPFSCPGLEAIGLGDDLPLDLVRAGVDRHHERRAHVALHVVLG